MRSSIETNWVTPDKVNSRLDAEYYQSFYQEAEAKVSEVRHRAFRTLWSEANRIYIGIKGYDTVENTTNFTPYLRPKDIGPNGEIDFNRLGWCEKSWLKDHQKKGTAKPGDLVVEVKGNTQKVAVLGDKVPENCIVSGSAWRIQISQGADKHFIQAYLLSDIGQLLKKRLVSNSVIVWIDPDSFKEMKIPFPPREIQTYIGDKVRLAERCRETASSCRQEITTLLRKHSGLLAIEEAFARQQKQLSHFVESSVIDDRLDAEFYHPSNLDVDKTIQTKPWIYLKSIIHLPIKGIQPAYDQVGTVPAITGTNIDPDEIDINSAQKVTKEWAESMARAAAQPGEVLITVTGPPLGEAAVAHKHHCPLVINSHVARIKPRAKFPYPNYLAAVLNSAIGSIQVYRYCKGVRQKELYPDQIHQFIIPEIDIEVIKQIDQLGSHADLLDHQSIKLISEAKSDVEKLIEDKLDTEGIMAGRIKTPTWEDIQAKLEERA